MARRFRKIPVTIEAVQFTGFRENREEVLDFLGTKPDGQIPDGVAHINGLGWVVVVHTPEGVMYGQIGDWIIRGTAGELYPCKEAIFAGIYEEVMD